MYIYRNRKLFLIISLILLIILVMIYFWLIQTAKLDLIYQINKSKVIIRHQQDERIITVLWWTPIIKIKRIRQCGYHKCLFTVDRNLVNSSEAILFYGSDLEKTDWPLPRQPHHQWGLLHEESPKNVPYISHDAVLQHFNMTSTFSRYSTFPINMQYLKYVKMLTSHKYLVPIGTKQMLRRDPDRLAPVVYVQSICDTMTGRDEYVKELMQYIEVDSYGQCLHNKDLPEELSRDYLNKIDSPEFYKFLARYKFIISYENGICNDYISEKFWRPLIIGSIPVYFGSSTVRDWEPINKTVIYIEDFPSPKSLANFLKRIDENKIEYLSYLDHKYKIMHPITNQRLLDIMVDREFWTSDDDIGNIFEEFECNVCKELHNMAEEQVNRQHTVDRRHYDCPSVLKFPPMKTNMDAIDWHSIMAVGKCQADILDRLFRRNKNFTQKEFDDLLTRDVIANKCNSGEGWI